MGCQRSDNSLPRLRAALAALGLDPPPPTLPAFVRYRDLLLAASARMSLTALRDPEAIERQHFVESVAFGAALVRAGLMCGSEAIVDVGAGAGFPGLPLRLVWPELRLTLLEATTKKAAFLRDAVETLGLHDVRVVNARAEEAGRDPALRSTFDLAVSRAVAPLPLLAEWTLPLVHSGGCTAALKGSRLDEEIAAARAAIDRCGGGQPRELPFPLAAEGSSLPAGSAPRPRIVVVPKVRRTPSWWPRRTGAAAKYPLT